LIYHFFSLNHLTERTVNDPLTNNENNSLVEADSNNNGQRPTNLHQLTYASNDDYPSNSNCGNHVSSSQPGNELNEECRYADIYSYISIIILFEVNSSLH
jgi:hypothetical protein